MHFLVKKKNKWYILKPPLWRKITAILQISANMLSGSWQGFDKLAKFSVTTLICKRILQVSKRKAKNHLEKNMTKKEKANNRWKLVQPY